MFRQATAAALGKVSVATLLLAFVVLVSAGPMRCVSGAPMQAPEPSVAKIPMAKDHSCCAAKAQAPKPVEEKAKCCCIDAIKKSAVDFGAGKVVDFRFDFTILLAPSVKVALFEPLLVVQQVRWPEVHGPPGIERHPVSPRAPPVA